MGMPIDEARRIIISGKPNDRNFSMALVVAIDTMRKYQQIEEIYKNWCYPTHINAVEAMNKLGEVLKDGND